MVYLSPQDGISIILKNNIMHVTDKPDHVWLIWRCEHISILSHNHLEGSYIKAIPIPNQPLPNFKSTPTEAK